ncbi:MAG: amidohydrolase [Flavobacteriales bacterium]|nr:amidohydrolase [Flavobacteriia bacterium]NCP05400.1 amidohydrolase [Flavobacteriales bacterium]PIV94938.1 MAG: amidohydrolase [Flavobacteriaceae bacterium CG17_big_fil_post_rev_8_21_14_2_50_33_15]PIY11378.1 MAG: amidohydrolase [Flavobacteriaceae bacterium CG_4_10_14_3_um_filter_33_47]PJB19207.1 MAG: amidohydrolase [Flavobacteriaceae bacterium CG_4_9_14_3_um_filter_33_16]
MKKTILFLFVISIVSCQNKLQVDAIVMNAKVYSVNSNFEEAEAFAIKNGKFVEVGTSNDIQKKYTSEEIIDAKGQTIVPGFIDAHCHFFGMGLAEQEVKLEGTTSYNEVITRIIDFQNRKKVSFIVGRGWDQNDWETKEFPTKEKLDSVFPDIPVVLTRVDGHAMLVNQAALNLTALNAESHIDGGEIILENGKLTGVILDAAMSEIRKVIPSISKEKSTMALKDAERICLNLGLTTVDEAGLDKSVIDLIDSLQQAGELNIRVYAMARSDDRNLDYYLNKGIVKTNKLNVRSFKFVADGALGSRGATLRAPYSDRADHYGTLSNSFERLQSVAKRISNSKFQMNSHAIGDSANHIVLNTYKTVLKNKKDRRWRVEHAQILSEEDFELFDDIIPSIQPTHATSDMYWAADRIGNERIKNGYAFKKLLNKYGKIALGTDFPVEHVSPFLTFYAAVSRQDLDQYPEDGFQIENALTREETLKGMTIWAAYSNFEEEEKGSIEAGKLADFIILDKDIMETPLNHIPTIKVIKTFIDGKAVYNQ